MDKLLILLLSALLLAGCTFQVDPVPVSPVACAYDVRSPVVAAGALGSSPGPDGMRCVPPAKGDLFSVHLSWDSGEMILAIPRDKIRVGTNLPIGANALLYGRTDTLDCVEWTGDVIVQGDLPHWGVRVEAACFATPTFRIVGQFEGE